MTPLQKGHVTLSEAKGLFIVMEMLRFAQHDKTEFFQWTHIPKSTHDFNT